MSFHSRVPEVVRVSIALAVGVALAHAFWISDSYAQECQPFVEFDEASQALTIVRATIDNEETTLLRPGTCLDTPVRLGLMIDDVDDVVGVCRRMPYCDAEWATTGDIWTVTWSILPWDPEDESGTYLGCFVNARGERVNEISNVDHVIYEPPGIDMAVGEIRHARIECLVRNVYQGVQHDEPICIPGLEELPFFEMLLERRDGDFNLEMRLPTYDQCLYPPGAGILCTRDETETCPCEVGALVATENSPILADKLPGQWPSNGVPAGQMRAIGVWAIDLDDITVVCGEPECDPPVWAQPFFDYTRVTWKIVGGGGLFLDRPDGSPPDETEGHTAIYLADPSLTSQVTVTLRVTVDDERPYLGPTYDRLFFDDEPYEFDIEFTAYPEGVLGVEFEPSERLELLGNDAAHGGGHSFFPDAHQNPNGSAGEPDNRARIRVRLDESRDLHTVYVQCFDVDDASSLTTDHRAVDPVTYAGEEAWLDNRGTVIDGPGGRISWPGPSFEAGSHGYNGRLRPIRTEFPDPLEFAGDTCKVAVPVKIVEGEAIAELELATTFAPGDNFRVFASTNPYELDALWNVPTEAPVPTFSGASTYPLTIWRRLYIEHDVMNKEGLGDRVTETVSSITTTPGGSGLAQAVVQYGPGEAMPLDDQYKGGVFRHVTGSLGGWIDSQKYVASQFGQVFELFAWSPTSQFPGGDYEFYEDDLRLVEQGFGVWEFSLHVDPSTPQGILNRLETSKDAGDNALSVAFILPVPYLETSDAAVAPVRHVENLTGVYDQNIEGGPYRESIANESDVFWVAYLANAFEPAEHLDGDPSTEPLRIAEWGGGLTPEIGVVFLECLREGLAGSITFVEGMRRAGVKLVAMQFGLPEVAGTATAADFHASGASTAFDPSGVARMRRQYRSPGRE